MRRGLKGWGKEMIFCYRVVARYDSREKNTGSSGHANLLQKAERKKGVYTVVIAKNC